MKILDRQNYHLTDAANETLGRYIALRKTRPHFANARSIRNALDRARLRQANRLVNEIESGKVTAEALMTIEASDIAASRVFSESAEADGNDD